MTPLSRAARALCKAQSDTDCYDDLEPEAQERAKDHARAVLEALREPSDAMLALTVQRVGDPSPENWAAGERVCAMLGGSLVAGETAVAEVARDYQAMIDAALSE